jgi:copper oxidase (laccase) domain-containing protein
VNFKATIVAMNPLFSESLKYGVFQIWAQRPEIDLLNPTQVHGTEIVSSETLPCEADGLFCSWTDFKTPLAIKTADCLPIVIEGEKGVIFLHAGWRGLSDGILNRPEIEIIKPESVFIGPSIQECCFEVLEDFIVHFPESPFFRKKNNKYFFNLQAEAKRKLELNFSDLPIKTSSICTCCHLEFNSYRRNKTKERNWNLYLKG